MDASAPWDPKISPKQNAKNAEEPQKLEQNAKSAKERKKLEQKLKGQSCPSCTSPSLWQGEIFACVMVDTDIWTEEVKILS